MRTACCFTVLVCLMCPASVAQQPPSDLAPALRTRSTVAKAATEPSLAKTAAVFRAYLRDIAESRFDVRSTITVYGANEIPDKTIRKKHKFGVQGVRFDDFYARVNFKADRGTFWLQTIPDHVVFFDPLVVSRADKSLDSVQFEAFIRDAKTLKVSYRSANDCSAFEHGDSKALQWRLKAWCGEGVLTLDTATLLPVSTSFHARGLPLIDGKNRLDDYQVEQEFQVLQTADGSGTRILPKKVTATFMTEKGKIVVENEFVLLNK
jgi:hypothetical protein